MTPHAVEGSGMLSCFRDSPIVLIQARRVLPSPLLSLYLQNGWWLLESSENRWNFFSQLIQKSERNSLVAGLYTLSTEMLLKFTEIISMCHCHILSFWFFHGLHLIDEQSATLFGVGGFICESKTRDRGMELLWVSWSRTTLLFLSFADFFQKFSFRFAEFFTFDWLLHLWLTLSSSCLLLALFFFRGQNAVDHVPCCRGNRSFVSLWLWLILHLTDGVGIYRRCLCNHTVRRLWQVIVSISILRINFCLAAGVVFTFPGMV